MLILSLLFPRLRTCMTYDMRYALRSSAYEYDENPDECDAG
jgi:hypothetical protein